MEKVPKVSNTAFSCQNILYELDSFHERLILLVEFKTATPANLSEVLNFIKKHYLPYEKVMNASGFGYPPTGMVDSWIQNKLLKAIIEPLSKPGQRLLARSRLDGSIVG